MLAPVILAVIAVDVQDCFYCLIRAFRLAVRLGVVGRAHILLDFELFAYLLE